MHRGGGLVGSPRGPAVRSLIQVRKKVYLGLNIDWSSSLIPSSGGGGGGGGTEAAVFSVCTCEDDCTFSQQSGQGYRSLYREEEGGGGEGTTLGAHFFLLLY